jgi:UrcA family protein
MKTMTVFAKSILGHAAVLAVLAGAGPALAGSAEGAVQVIVGHADLNLAEARDVARLDRRLRLAAREVCGINVNDTARRLAARECETRTLAGAAEPRRAAIAAAAGSAPRSAMAARIVMRAR